MRETTSSAIAAPKKNDDKVKLLEVIEENKSFQTMYKKFNLDTYSRSSATSYFCRTGCRMRGFYLELRRSVDDVQRCIVARQVWHRWC